MRRPTATGRLSTNFRSTFDILSLKLYLTKEIFFLCFVGKSTYHKYSFTSPLLIIQIRAQKQAFFSLSFHKPHIFRRLYIDRR